MVVAMGERIDQMANGDSGAIPCRDGDSHEKLSTLSSRRGKRSRLAEAGYLLRGAWPSAMNEESRPCLKALLPRRSYLLCLMRFTN